MTMGEAQKPGRATPLQVARAVFWSFFGVRKRAAYERDAVSLTPLQVIVAGIIGAVILVLSLVTLVHFIIS
ncbi:MAG: DUF2970 domain-containing protein [Betaproteobacteria bacterium]|jgi:hypothetical protein|nr:DUF2970 domain-containing protein [Betaproteobacteria bacterium]